MGATNSLLADSKAVSPVSTDMPLWGLEVIQYCPWETRAAVGQLSRSWRKNTQTQQYYRFLCARLVEEHGIYMPKVPPPRENWKTLFFELFKLRHLWDSTGRQLTPAMNAALHDRSKISVYAKFRPHVEKPRLRNKPSNQQIADVEGTEQDENDENRAPAGVTLPLHQRLAMIRMSHKIKNNRSALKVLAEEGAWFQAKWSSLANTLPEQNNEQDQAFMTEEDGSKNQAQHMITKLQQKHHKSANGHNTAHHSMISKIHSLDTMNGRVVMLTPDVGLREFAYDGILPTNASQKHAYDVSTKRLIMDMLNGFNATAIVYGQTGSGKTYTMFGNEDITSASHHTGTVYHEGKGIVPRACEEILAAMAAREQQGIVSVLSVAYVEIYGDQVSDLLKQGSRVGHSKVASQRYVLNGAAEQIVYNMEDIFSILQQGEAQKRKAATAMNDRSTRAHSLFILTLKQSMANKQSTSSGPEVDELDANAQVTIQSRLFLADLGGSEQVKKSQVEAGGLRVHGADNQFSVGFQMADHMREAVYINLGLLALKKCIENLNHQLLYIPFKDSKLTMLLSEGLGGNSKTSVIICANMDPEHATETVATLRFGERCALVETSATNNATMLANILAKLDEQIDSLEKEILQKERWEVKEEIRDDELAEEGTLEKAMGAKEVRKITYLVGAEEERLRLGELLLQRAQFTGASSYLDENEEGENTFTDDETAAVSSNGANAEKKSSTSTRVVMGFGKQYGEMYGFGGKYEAELEENLENTRFQGSVNLQELPTALRATKNANKAAWATGVQINEEDAEKLEKKAKKAKRNKLAYSSISF